VQSIRPGLQRARMAFSFDAIGFILGLGYAMGLKCAHDIGVASARLWIWNAMGPLADLESDTASAV
jgi:hypothetical protein